VCRLDMTMLVLPEIKLTSRS